jgi:hypothetical protein
VLVKDIQMVYCYEDLLDETIQLGDSGRRIVYALLLKPTEPVQFRVTNTLLSLCNKVCVVYLGIYEMRELSSAYVGDQFTPDCTS